MAFTPTETTACRRLIEIALEEDLGTVGDLTSQAVIPADLTGRAVVIARAYGVLAGLPAAELAFAAIDPQVVFEPFLADTTTVQPGTQLARITGPLRSILTGERTALNFLQHLSGIASLTRRFVEAVRGLRCQILDTRKTTPGWRLLEKYAVRQGGGHNHRMGLCDGVLIKDNHLAALKDGPQPISSAVQAALRHVGGSVPVEIEVDNLDQLEEALACAPEIILLDNMELDDLQVAVRLRNELLDPEADGGTLLEASGGVTLANVRAIAETGVDRISVGALTHSAPALDIALDYTTE
jgi:nicotinate-nucleotide pyrophosphorylase (carboxylating)